MGTSQRSFTNAPLKVCNKCRKEKPATGDFFQPDGHEGLTGECRMCLRDKSRKYYTKTQGREPKGTRRGRGPSLTVKAS